MEDIQPRHSRGWIAFGLALLGLLLILCTCRDARMIQADLWGKGRAALEAKNYDPTLLSFSGRDALLKGEIASEAIKADMETTIRGVRGVRQAGLRNELNISSSNLPVILQDPELVVSIDDGKVKLSGLVPTDSRAKIVAAAEQLYGNANIVDNLQTADDVENPGWMSGVLGLLPQIKNELSSGTLRAEDTGLTLEGQAPTEQIKSGLGLAADNATDLAITNNIAVITPELKPASLSMVLKDGKVTLEGTLPETTIAPAVEAATQAVGAENVVNNLQAAADIEAPVWAPGLFGALPALSKQTADLGLTVNDNTLMLTGMVGSSEEREIIGKAVRDAVGETVTVDNRLDITATTPAQVRIKVASDAVQLSGALPQTAADRLLELSEKVSSTGSVVNQLSVDQHTLTPEWLPKALEFIPQYAKDVSEAELTIQDQVITLVGSVPTEEQKTNVETAMRAIVGEEPTIANQLRVVPVLVEPILSIKAQDDQVQISGTVSQDVATKVAETLPNVESTLAVADNISSPAYMPALLDTLPAYLNDVKQPSLELKDKLLTLSGIVSSEEKKSEISAKATQAAGPTVQVVNNLAVVPSVPAQLQVKVNDGVAQIEGNVPTVVAAEVIEAVSTPETTAVENQVASALNVDLPSWLPNVVDVLPKVTTEVKDADVAIVADTITLVGTVKTDEQKAEVASQVSTAAGPNVKVINNLQVVPPPPVRLQVKVSNGQVKVEGNVPQELVTEVIDTVETFPAIADEVALDNVTNDIVSDPEVEVPAWLPKVVDILPTATAEVKNADVAILGNTLTLGGTVLSEEQKASIEKQVTKVADSEVAVVNNIVVDSPEAVELRITENGDDVAVQGNTEDAVAQAATTLDIASDQVSSEVVVTPEVQTPDWVSNVVNILPEITAEVQDADVSIVDKTITLAGTVSSEETKTKIASNVSNVAGSDVNVINNLQVVEPVVAEPEPVAEETVEPEAVVVEPVVEAEPVTELSAAAEPEPVIDPVVVEPEPEAIIPNPNVRIDIAGPEIRLTGSVPNTASADAADNGFADKTVTNALEPTEVADAPWLPRLYEVAPKVAGDINRASLVLEGKVLTLQGVTTSNEQRDSIGSYVTEAMQPEVTVINKLTVETKIPFVEDGK